MTQLLGWRSVYIFIGCFGAIGLVVMAIGFRESLERPDFDALRVQRIIASFGMLLGDASYRGYLIIGIGMHVSVFSIVAAMPSVVIGYLGLTPATFGYLYSIIMAIQLAGAMAGGRLNRHYGAAALTAAGVAIVGIAALTILGLALAGGMSAIALVMANGVFMAGFALLNPPVMAGALSNFHHMAGRATSLMGFVHQATGAVTVVAMGLLINDTPLPFAFGMVGGALVIVGAYVLLVRPLRARAS
jgi:DHA1 family bicyclomycin/chloramphenicol resistance-like MFS transporter